MIFNPASLAVRSGMEGALGVTGLFTSVTYSNQSASTILGTPISGNGGGNAGTNVAVPNLYFATDAWNDVRVGIGRSPRDSDSGLYWADGWVGGYYALDSELTTIDVVPTISYRVNRTLALGLAIDMQYAKVKTTSAIDFGTIDQILAGGAFGGIPAGSDGFTSSDATSWVRGSCSV